jgi:hypothetical protein
MWSIFGVLMLRVVGPGDLPPYLINKAFLMPLPSFFSENY